MTSNFIAQNSKANTHLTFDYQNLTDAKLKPFANALKSAGEEVVNIQATNKSRRKNGFPEKSATFALANGQAITIFVSPTGDLVQVKINARVFPVRDTKDQKSLARELIREVKRTQESFNKQQEKKAKKIVAGIKQSASAASNLKTIQSDVATAKESLEETNAQLRQLEISRDKLKEQLDTVTTDTAEADSEIKSLTKQITEAKKAAE